MQFKVADFKMAYNAFLRRSALTKFIVIPHFGYLVLKMLGPNRVISIKGDVKCAYDCDMEHCETTDMLLASVELQELRKALTLSHPDAIIPEDMSSKVSIQPEDDISKTIPLSPNEPSKVAHVGNNLDPK
jgi:hypothetical protein